MNNRIIRTPSDNSITDPAISGEQDRSIAPTSITLLDVAHRYFSSACESLNRLLWQSEDNAGLFENIKTQIDTVSCGLLSDAADLSLLNQAEKSLHSVIRVLTQTRAVLSDKYVRSVLAPLAQITITHITRNTIEYSLKAAKVDQLLNALFKKESAGNDRINPFVSSLIGAFSVGLSVVLLEQSKRLAIPSLPEENKAPKSIEMQVKKIVGVKREIQPALSLQVAERGIEIATTTSGALLASNLLFGLSNSTGLNTLGMTASSIYSLSLSRGAGRMLCPSVLRYFK